jgi:hypothetical protein
MSLGKSIAEYLEMVKNGVKNRDQIIEAMRNAAKIKEERTDEISDEEVAEIMRRKEICAGCRFNSRNAKVQRNYNSSLPFEHCTLCKCRIGYDDSKEYCLTCNCGILVWNNNNPDLPPMELKWKAFDKNDYNKTDN